MIYFTDLTNVSYAVVDGCNVQDEMEASFDFVMLFDVYHDVPYPDQLLGGVKKLLRPGGLFLMNDIETHERITDNKTSQGKLVGS